MSSVSTPSKLDDDMSVEDMLASVDQFIEGVYRDLSLSPPRRSSMANTTNLSRSLDTSSSISTISPAGTATVPRRESSSPSTTSPDVAATLPNTMSVIEWTPVSFPNVRRNMNAEIERINQMCDNVDQNLRSIGLFMNNSSPSSITENLSNTNLINSPSSSTSIIIVNNTTPTFSSAMRRKRVSNVNPSFSRNAHSRRLLRRSSVAIDDASVIDLSNSQVETPNTVTRTVHTHNHEDDEDDDDDVILVSAYIPPVVDLCTPCGDQENNRSIDHSESPLHTHSDSTCQLVKEIEPADKSEGRDPFMCPVCMESCLRRQPTSTVCGHVFCEVCIEQALALSRKCPLCNRRLKRGQTFRIYL